MPFFLRKLLFLLNFFFFFTTYKYIIKLEYGMVFMKKRYLFKLFVFLLLCFNSFSVFAKDVEIENVRIVEKSGTVDADNISYQNSTISPKIVFHQLNDFITLEVNIQNKSNIDYRLSSISNELNNNYLMLDSSSYGSVIPGNSTQSFLVKVLYNNQLYNQDEFVSKDLSFSLVFVDSTKLENAFTGNTIFLIIVFILLTFAVCLCYFLFTKRKKRVCLLFLLFVPLVVLAKEEDINCKISFDQLVVKGTFLDYQVVLKDDNNIVDSYVKVYGKKIDALPVMEKDGYVFHGWVDQFNNDVSNDLIVTQDLNLVASYLPISYSITYQLNGGIEKTNPTKYTIEDEFMLKNPTKVGYTFSGWSVDDDNSLQTNITIFKGTKGDKVFTAHYSTNENTEYTVIHRLMDTNGNYVEKDRETLHGATDTTVSPQVKTYEGFISPPKQSKVISGDGLTTFIYDYPRAKYSFTISDRSHLTSSSSPNGEYYYGTSLSVSVNPISGYHISWSDGDTNYNRTFSIKENLTLSYQYLPNTDTEYTVIHKKMNLDGTSYTTANHAIFKGTTDSTVTPNVNQYEGFTSPNVQSLLITGDGNATITYYYQRNKYHLTLKDAGRITTRFSSGDYYYGTSITIKANCITGYKFSKWSNEITQYNYTFELKEDVTLSPVYVTRPSGTTPSECSTNNNPLCLSGEMEVVIYDKKKKKRFMKKLKDVTLDDLILTWNFDTGEFEFVEPSFIRKIVVSDTHYVLTFSDGSILDVIGDHRVFNLDKNEFTHCVSDIETPIGTKTINDKGEVIVLVSKEIVYSPVDVCSVITKKNYNFYANGILTSISLNNLYPIQDMKFVKTSRKTIQFNDLDVDRELFDVLRYGEFSDDFDGEFEYTKRFLEHYAKDLASDQFISKK